MTAAQLAACRENAQFSTGPKTLEGKKRSSLNVFRHGLTGQIVIHTPEDQAAFQKHCDAIREALAPVGALELELAQAIAEDAHSKTPSSPSAFKSTPTPTPPIPKSTPLSPKAAPGSAKPRISSSSSPTNRGSAAPSKRTWPSLGHCKPSARQPSQKRKQKPACSSNLLKPKADTTTRLRFPTRISTPWVRLFEVRSPAPNRARQPP